MRSITSPSTKPYSYNKRNDLTMHQDRTETETDGFSLSESIRELDDLLAGKRGSVDANIAVRLSRVDYDSQQRIRKREPNKSATDIQFVAPVSRRSDTLDSTGEGVLQHQYTGAIPAIPIPLSQPISSARLPRQSSMRQFPTRSSLRQPNLPTSSTAFPSKTPLSLDRNTYHQRTTASTPVASRRTLQRAYSERYFATSPSSLQDVEAAFNRILKEYDGIDQTGW